jgi:hypothetical protein
LDAWGEVQDAPICHQIVKSSPQIAFRNEEEERCSRGEFI